MRDLLQNLSTAWDYLAINLTKVIPRCDDKLKSFLQTNIVKMNDVLNELKDTINTVDFPYSNEPFRKIWHDYQICYLQWNGTFPAAQQNKILEELKNHCGENINLAIATVGTWIVNRKSNYFWDKQPAPAPYKAVSEKQVIQREKDEEKTKIEQSLPGNNRRTGMHQIGKTITPNLKDANEKLLQAKWDDLIKYYAEKQPEFLSNLKGIKIVPDEKNPRELKFFIPKRDYQMLNTAESNFKMLQKSIYKAFTITNIEQ